MAQTKTKKISEEKEVNLPEVRKMWPVVDALIAAFPKLTEEERGFVEKDIHASLKRILVVRDHKENNFERSMQSIEEKIAMMGNTNKNIISVSEGPDNAYFIININGRTKSFTLDEMKKLVKISAEQENSISAVRKMYTWFEQNRRDIILDLDMKKNDVRLYDLIEFLASKYTTK